MTRRLAPVVALAPVAATVALLAALSSLSCRGWGRPNVLLIVIDTARADRFSFDGYARDTSPEIAAIAREGAVYERALTPAPWTLPAHASLFTGLFPSTHGADSGHLWLDEERLTLAESFRDDGYRTVAYIENPCIGKLFNFQQGFETFDEIWRNVTKDSGDSGAGLTNLRIDRWLSLRDANAEARRQPFFMFINYVEPHLPYKPPDPERIRFLSSPIDMPAVERLSRFRHPEEVKYILGSVSLTANDLRVLSDLYDGEIAYVDRRIGEVLELLRRRDLLDDTVVAITADHGEEIGEHGFLDHKMNVYEPLLRIPMVLRYPRAVRAGQRIKEPVMLQDLYPTLLRLAGLHPAEPPGGSGGAGPRESVVLPGVDGVGRAARRGAAIAEDEHEPLIAEFARPLSFLDVMRESSPPGHDISAWDRALVSFRSGSLKLHWGSDGRHRLFDLARDPSEEHDLSAEQPDTVRSMARRVEAWLHRPGVRPPTGLEGTTSPIPPNGSGPPPTPGADNQPPVREPD